MIDSELINPKISVIISTFNQDKYIGRCIRSLLEQNISKDKYELIIINDGSTDRTEYAIGLFRKPNSNFIKYLSNEINIGLPASINKGINIAKGDYIVRVDSDDFVNKNFLNFLAIYLETNPESDAVACDYLVLDDNENVIENNVVTTHIRNFVPLCSYCTFSVDLLKVNIKVINIIIEYTYYSIWQRIVNLKILIL